MKFCRNVLQVNTHRLTESDFRLDSHVQHGDCDIITHSAATWSVNSKRQPGTDAAAFRQFLIYCTFVLVS